MRSILAFTGLCVVLALTAIVVGGPDDAMTADPTEGASYVGEKTCKKCHMKQHRSWRKMKHHDAFKNLPVKHHGDKNDDGKECISCHVTGYGQADRGGFKSIAESEGLLGVQCEACHGPGSNHVKAASKVTDEKRDFKPGEKKFIVRKTKNCTNCHNPHNNYKKKYGGDG